VGGDVQTKDERKDDDPNDTGILGFGDAVKMRNQTTRLMSKKKKDFDK
jgi:hypothetical protein